MNQVFSQIHVRVAYLFLYLRSRYICYRKRTVPYRVLAHSHSPTSLYNFNFISQSAISLHQLFTSCPHLTCERAYFGLVLFFAIFTFWLRKYFDFVLFSRAILLAILFRSYLLRWPTTLTSITNSSQH
jgi:hypothetical protein